MERRGIIGIDIDGTVADTGGWFASALSTVTGKKLAVNDVTGHDWIAEGICTQEQCDEVISMFYEGGGSLEVPPIKGAIEVIKKLSKIWYTYFVTARPDSMFVDTEKWMVEHDCPYNRLILTGSHNKHELDIPFDVFIEDRYETALAMAEKGCYSLLLDNAWNRKGDTSHIFMKRVFDWDEIYREVRMYDYAQSN